MFVRELSALTMMLAGTTAGTPPHATDVQQPLLKLLQPVVVRAQPGFTGQVVATVAAYRPLTGQRTVLPVIGETTGRLGRTFVRIRLPNRPNGAAGWIPADAGAPRTTPWQIVVHRGTRSAEVLKSGLVQRRFRVVVGKPSTPTPLGTFFVAEKLHLGAGVAEGPWALATSAYSNVLQEFAGGPGQIALHGVTGLSAPLGTFSSHGCIRFGNTAITWIAARVGTGTPIVVRR